MYFKKIWDLFLAALRDELDIESHVLGFEEGILSHNKEELRLQDSQDSSPIEQVVPQET